MGTLVDPWGGYNQGMQNLGQTFTDLQQLDRQKKMDAVTLRQLALQEKMQGAKLGEMEAEQGATQQIYGGPDLATAYANKMKAEIKSKKVGDFFSQMKLMKDAGASPEFRTKWAKDQLAGVPEYAPMADSISYMDDEKIKLVKDIGANQLPDPSNPGQFMPPGKYELEGQATGDPKQPYKFSTIKPFIEKDAGAHNVIEIPTPDGKHAQKFMYNPVTNQYDKPVGQPYLVKSQVPNVNVRVNGPAPVQQSQFVDPETGRPLVFDKKTGSYRVADVEGGAVAPRPVNPSAGEREKTAALESLKSQLDRIESDYKPEYVGILSGTTGSITQYGDENEAAYRQLISDVKDTLLRARSGAQINEQEYRRLSKLVPGVTDSETKFKGKLKSFRTSINAIISERAKAQKRGGVVIRGQSAPKQSGRFTVEEVK